MTTEKRCNRCRLVKPLELFSRKKTTADGRGYTCKSCASQQRREPANRCLTPR